MYICLPHRSVDSLILIDRLCKCNILPSHHQVFYQKNIIIVKNYTIIQFTSPTSPIFL